MTTIETPPAAPAVDMDALMEFVGKFVGDLGATIGAGNVLLGERLGLYRALAQQPGDARSVAAATGTDPRYVDEWLRGQAAGGYVQYDAATATYSMTPEQAFALTDPGGPRLPAGRLRARPGRAQGAAPHRGVVPHRGRVRLERARPGRLHRLRAVLPPRLPHAPAHRVDPRAGRRPGQARARRLRGRPRVRSRCLHPAHGRRLPAQHLRRLGLPLRLDRGRADAGRRRRGPASGCGSRWPAPRSSTRTGSTWSRRSTACTTWATRWPRRSTSAAPWRRTGRGCWSSPPPATPSSPT